LKDEQHKVYSLCRSFGLMGDIDRKNEEATGTGTGDGDMLPSLKMRLAVSFLRSFSCILVISWGAAYSTFGLSRDPYGMYDDPGFEGFSLLCKVLSLCLLCWIVAGMLLTDMWRDDKGGFFFSLTFTSFWAIYVGIIQKRACPFLFFSWVSPLVYFVATCHFSRLRFRDTANDIARIPRVALLYRQYFGVDGEYFAMKSAATQSLSVLLQAYAKLLHIGMVVADGVTEGWYWSFFCVLLLNCIVPPLLLSSNLPWQRRQGVMLFDIGCDLFYIMGFVVFMIFHQGNIPAVFPTGVGPFFSNLFPTLRILSIGRVLMRVHRGRHCQESTHATGIYDDQKVPPLPSKLTPKAASFFACFSLFMLATVVCLEQGLYPWNGDPCRPCECSADRVLVRCEYGGTLLCLKARGITRVLPGAFVENDLPNLREMALSYNSIHVVESGTFANLPALRILRMNANRVNTTSWLLETFFPSFRRLVETNSGLASIERSAFANNSKLEVLVLNYNSFVSIRSVAGVLLDTLNLQELWLLGNTLACEDVVLDFDGSCF
jgi:hypothetical protein